MDRSKMEPRITSGPKMGTHFVDIHEVLHEDEEEEETSAIRADKGPETKRFNKPQRFREPKTQQLQNHQRNFSRQVSLETGFSAFKKESKARDEKTVLRSGRSFSGFESGNRNGMDGRRGDFSIFKTKSTLSKQNSLLPSTSRKDGIPPDPQKKDGPAAGGTDESKSVPAGRYFAALRGPELDQVKDFEDILLPKDEIWPFLLRFPIGCFGICLGLSSQAVLWHALDISPATKFLHIAPFVNLGLWLLALAFMIAVSCTYMLKCICYFEAIKREYFHPVRVNFFFAPWVVCMFLAISAPPMFVPGKLHPAFFCIFMVPYFLLELKIYGQWLSGGKRRLCKVANPSSHLSVVGNFVGAILASKVGWQEPGKFLWAVGFAHYLVLFVTLYQRLPTSEALPKELHPVYSMFIAAPSAASIAWETIYGEFDGSARTCYFIALFLYISLVVRINFFTGFKFSVAWWSYTFPMTTISVATIKYATHVPCTMTKILALGLSFMSSTMVALLLVSTFLHAFVWKTLFPNDLAIAITTKRQGRDNYKKPMRKSIDLRKWTKQTPLSFVSNMTKHGSAKKNSDGENDEE